MSKTKVYKTGTYEYWYDRSAKGWKMSHCDDDGTRVGETVDAATKSLILGAIRRARQAAYDLKFPADPVRDAEIAKRAEEWQAGAPARAKKHLAESIAEELGKEGIESMTKSDWIMQAKRYLKLESGKAYDGSTKVQNSVLRIADTYHSLTIVYVPKGSEGRQECGGAMIPGPWASTFGNGSMLTAQRIARDPETEIENGDVLMIDGIDFRVRVFRGQYIALDRIENDGSLQPTLGH